MSILNKKSKGIIWLNPNKSDRNFTPATKGMKAALPFIDIFKSAHNFQTLRELVEILKKNNKFNL